MIPPQFEYFRPVSLDDALRLLADNEGEAKILAGGYSLLPLMKYRLAQPGLLIDIGRVPGLESISQVDGEFRIGARATHAAIASSPAAAAWDVVREAAGGIGDPQIRNWGTIGGSCAHADPASDWPAVILSLRVASSCAASTASGSSGPGAILARPTSGTDRPALDRPIPALAKVRRASSRTSSPPPSRPTRC